MRLFVDTSALAALYRRDDSRHADAAAFILAAGKAELHTNNFVFSETMTLLASHHGQDAAVRFGTDYFASRRLIVHYADESLERGALAVMRAYRDKRLSFTDASAIAVVRTEGLDGVFGFDEDFRRCGVALYP
ncbi:MAG: PIN domain-containing protein [Elusimicrobiota bacterium]